MNLNEAIENAKRWASSARALEKICRSGGYQFMAGDSQKEAEVLETLIAALEKGEQYGKHEPDRPDPAG